MFLLMGHLATHAGISKALFRAANAFFGSWRGGLSIASIGGCAMFGAISGSSLATAATMGKVALPEMNLIPPSVILVIYAIITEQNVAKMFLAAFIPGFIAAIGYMITVSIYVRIYPEAGPAGDKTDMQVSSPQRKLQPLV